MSTARASTAAVATPVPAREGTGATQATSADGAAFLDLLLQVSGAAVVPSLPAAGAIAPGAEDQASDETEPAAPDWVAPFLPPAVSTPTPLDFELHAGGPAEGGPIDLLHVMPAADDGNPVTPLPVLLDDEGKFAGDDLAARLAEPSRTSLHGVEQSAVSLSRVESTPNGGHAVVRTIPVPVADHRWPERLGHEVRILVDGGVQQATLRLNPEHLGPVEVRIDVVNDRANVVFGASHADTRAALTEAIPKLREMFAGAGLTLGDAGVRQDAPGANPQAPQRTANDGFSAGSDETPVATETTARLGLVDAYA